VWFADSAVVVVLYVTVVVVQVRCASPTVAKCPKAGYSFMARGLSRNAQRGLIHAGLAKQLIENKYLSVLEQEINRVSAEKAQAQVEEVLGSTAAQKNKKKMLNSLHRTASFPESAALVRAV
jgi:hypothetical protein